MYLITLGYIQAISLTMLFITEMKLFSLGNDFVGTNQLYKMESLNVSQSVITLLDELVDALQVRTPYPTYGPLGFYRSF